MGQDNSSTKEPDYRPIAPRKKEKRPVKYVTTVFTWPFGGKSVCIIGSFNKWKQEIPMPYNHDDRAFSLALTLRTGKHYIRYIVDDEFQVDKRLPTHHDRDGYYSNIIYIREEKNPTHMQADDSQSQSQDLSPVSPTGHLNITPKGSRQRNSHQVRVLCVSEGDIGIARQENVDRVKRLPNKPPLNHSYPKNVRQFGRVRPNFFESRKTPPLLPPHLGYTNLNASTYDPPSKEGMDYFGPNILPLPVHVTSNHLYFFYPSPERDPSLGRLVAYGLTCYIGSKDDRKFSTVKFYTPGLTKTRVKFQKLSSLKKDEKSNELNQTKLTGEEEYDEKNIKKVKNPIQCEMLRIGLKGSLNGVMIRRRRIVRSRQSNNGVIDSYNNIKLLGNNQIFSRKRKMRRTPVVAGREETGLTNQTNQTAEEKDDVGNDYESTSTSSSSSSSSSEGLDDKKMKEEEEERRKNSRNIMHPRRANNALNMLNQLKSMVQEGNKELTGDD